MRRSWAVRSSPTTMQSARPHQRPRTTHTQTDGGNSNRRNIDRPHQRPRTTHTQTDGGNSNRRNIDRPHQRCLGRHQLFMHRLGVVPLTGSTMPRAPPTFHAPPRCRAANGIHDASGATNFSCTACPGGMGWSRIPRVSRRRRLPPSVRAVWGGLGFRGSAGDGGYLHRSGRYGVVSDSAAGHRRWAVISHGTGHRDPGWPGPATVGGQSSATGPAIETRVGPGRPP